MVIFHEGTWLLPVLYFYVIFLCLQMPLRAILVDGNCRVEGRGLKTHHGQVCLLFPFRYIVKLYYIGN
jgi:hypothetical protein